MATYIDDIIAESSFSANSISATTLIKGQTYFSGATLLETTISSIANALDTRIQPGSNITTGGTASIPTINLVSSPSINNLIFSGTATGNILSATTISGGTIYSGNTPLETIISNIASVSASTTKVQPGLNTYTGGTTNNPTVNISAATLSYLSATTVSASTFYSGNTNVGSLFGSAAAVATLQSQILTKTNRSGDTFTGQVNVPAFSATTISGGTIYSGGTDLYNIFQTIGSSGATITGALSLGSGIGVFKQTVGTTLEFRSLSAGTNITFNTGDTIGINVVNSPSFNNISFSGTAYGGSISATTIGAIIFSGGTFYGNASGLTGIAGNAIQTSATASTTTTSSTNSLINGMSATTQVGQYLILFSGMFSCSNSAAITTVSIFINGVQINTSVRQNKFGGNTNESTIIEKISTSPGSLVEIRWNTTAGTATCNQRTLILL